jgi:hypothetical protein
VVVVNRGFTHSFGGNEMNQKEFQGWKKITESSKDRWVFDVVMFMNSGDFMFYRGGESGIFILVNHEGRGSFGNYSMAVPSIGDAMFTTIHESTPSNCRFTSLSVVLESLGVPELWNLWGKNEQEGRVGRKFEYNGADFKIVPSNTKKNGSVYVVLDFHRVGFITPRREGFTHSRNSNEELDFPTITEAIETLLWGETNRGVFDQVVERFKERRLS